MDTATRKAKRMADLPVYLMDEVVRLKDQAVARGMDVIDLGVGDPDFPTPPHILAAAHGALEDGANHHYSSYRGLATLRRSRQRFPGGRHCLKSQVVEFARRARQDRGRVRRLPATQPCQTVYFDSFNPTRNRSLGTPVPHYELFQSTTKIAGTLFTFVKILIEHEPNQSVLLYVRR